MPLPQPSLNAANLRKLLSLTRIKAGEIRELIKKNEDSNDRKDGNKLEKIESVKANNESIPIEQLKDMLRSLENKIESLKKQVTDTNHENDVHMLYQVPITRSDLYQDFF